MQLVSNKSSEGQNRFLSVFFRAFTLSLLISAFAFTSLHAQTVAYVANAGSNSVSVIATATNTVTATISLASSPNSVVFSPDGSTVYVGDSTFIPQSCPCANGTIYVINTSSNTVVRTIPLSNGEDAASMAITPDGKTLYGSADTTGDVIVVDIAGGSITATLPGIGGGAIVVTPNGNTAYVSDNFSAVRAISTATNTVTATISVGQTFPARTQMAVTPDGSLLYVPLFGPGQVVVIATATNSVVGSPINVVQGPFGLAITPNGAFVYVPSGISTGGVSVISTATNTVVATVPAGHNIAEAAITPDNAFAYFTASNNGNVPVVDTATNTVVATVPVGSAPVGIAIATLPVPGTPASIAANFNGTAIPSGDSLWFSSVVKVFGLGSAPVTISVRQSSISFTVNGTKTTVPVPDADLTFDPGATTATTTFNTSLHRWQTTVPSSGLAGNVFLDGASFALPNGLPGGVQNVTWTGSFSTNTSGITLNWQWAAAAYTSLCGPDLNCLGVKPVDDNKASQFKNSDHAGTPENFKSNVVGGATGGGGSNFTGGYSGTKSVRPTTP
jgi:YVTN family beta-propeller protein